MDYGYVNYRQNSVKNIPRKTVLVGKLYEKKKYNTFYTVLKYWKTFFAESSIHGLSHLVDDKRHVVEILIWLSFVCAALYASIIISLQTWTRYQENPTVISMERDRFNWNTSFPSATICPTSQINPDKLEEFVEKSKVKNGTLLEDFLEKLSVASYKTFSSLPECDYISPDDYLSILLDLSLEFAPSVSNSGTNNQQYTLQSTITETGLCYAFNSKLAVYNSPEYWRSGNRLLVDESETFSVHPLDGEVFANIVNMYTGFYISIHGPYETTDVSTKSIFSENGYFLQVYLTALTLFSSDRAKDLRVEQRKCRFYYESNLPHSPVYSYKLCRIECRIQLAKQLCGCIPHFYRKLDGEKTCDVKGLHCLGRHADQLIPLKKDCKCLPNCDEVNYFIEDLDSREWFLGSNLQWGLKEYPRIRLKRDVLFGFTDLLVYFGGLTGLFFGCSVLSFIEIFYYLSLRLFWFTVNYANNNRRINTNKIKY